MTKKTDKEKLDFLYDMENTKAWAGIIMLILIVAFFIFGEHC